MVTRRIRAVVTLMAAVSLGASIAAVAPTASAAPAANGGDPVYLVHGYNDSGHSDCASLWGNAIDYFTSKGMDKSSIHTVGYYAGDSNCDVDLGDADTNTRIKDVAAALANHIYNTNTRTGRSVDIVAHSMGGLVTRVALLGSAMGWEGFPAKLKVGDVVTLATPHQGIIEKSKYHSVQWDSMVPGSKFLEVLQAPENRLDQNWAQGVDWSFVGSDEDKTVNGDSGIDKDRPAQHKYRYLSDEKHDLSHTNMRTLAPGGGEYNLRYWNASEGTPHDTTNGWAPLETAFNALDRGDA
ncbi:alpha/beta fold hydrolase [Nocardia sp. BMG51109]|uniref:esterase/lipase family protein n=1 Tax=Nocardia sp. BMG51109 TaxID=1056816 RepID=UPI0009FD6B42